ncbi:MAG: hypothetical protein WD934_02120 [Gemmatimonadales bacterium]
MAVKKGHGTRCTVHGARWFMVLSGLLLLPVAAGAQQSSLVRVSQYAKWPTLAAALGFTTVALMRNSDADDVYRALNTFCNGAPDACRLRVTDGVSQYVGPEPEALYQETLRLDRSARRWVLAGQVSLLAAGAMFFIDLVDGSDGPRNIPFDGASLVADGRRLGLRVAF